MYQHILLATELESISRNLEEQTAALKKLTAATLSVIHVVEPLPSAGAGEISLGYDYREDQKAITSIVKKKLRPLTQELGIPPPEVIVRFGNICDEILDYAEKNNVDLIVIGSHGCHGVQLLLGSTANAVLHNAKCDVLAVRIKE